MPPQTDRTTPLPGDASQDGHPPAARNGFATRSAAFASLAFAVLLTGCATTQDPAGSQRADNRGLLVARDRQLSDTRADPLGAYLERYAYSTATHAGIRAVDDIPDTRDLASAALDYLGIKYRNGGTSPSTGFDCSGLVSYAAEKSLGLKLPRRSAEMARIGQSVKRTELREGDLVFFNTLGARFSHVGIYLGDNKFVHSPRSGAVVRIESIDAAYWRKRYNGARRISPDMLAALSSDAAR